MLILIEDKENKNKCLKECDCVFCGDVVNNVFQCLLGFGYQRDLILDSFSRILEDYKYFEKEKKEKK